MTIENGLLTFLKGHIEKGEFTKADIAKFCGVSRSHISRSLKEGSASETLCKKLLDFSLDYKKKVAKTKKVVQTLNS